jgi:hypothetical protein
VLPKSGRETEAGQIREMLQQIVGDGRKIATKAPNVGVGEALARWDAVTGVVRMLARLRAEASS